MNKKELQYKRNQYAFCLKKIVEARKRLLLAEKEIQKYGEQMVKLEAELKPFVDIDLDLADLLTV